MTSFSSQFHATPDELIELVKEILDKHGVYATAVHSPFRTEAVSSNSARDVLSQPSVWKVIFTESPPILSSVATGTQLLDKNEGSLGLHIGRVKNHSLEESWLTTKNASPVWKKINALLKGRTKAGVIGTQEKTGASAFYRDHRHTAGARALSEQGIALRQDVQSPIVLRPADRPVKQ